MNWTDLHPFILEAGRTSLAVGILVALVLVIRKPFAKRFGANAGYALWALPLARFVMPPVPEGWSLASWLGSGAPADAPAPSRSDMAPTGFDSAGPQTDWVPVAPPVDLASGSASGIADSVIALLVANAPLIVVSAWVLGVLIWLGLSLRGQDVFQRLIWDDSEPPSEAILREAAATARLLGMKQAPHVRKSLLCSGPLVTGLKTPVVLLPFWFEEDYTPSEQRDALIHEFMHLKRRDLWAFQAARVIAATQWFNPLAHLALRAFRADQEAACDADVLRRAKLSPVAYGRTLVKAARLARPSDRRIAAASLTLAHPIKERLIMMTHPTPSLRSRLMGSALALTLGAGAMFATASCTSTAQEELAGEPETTVERETNKSFSFSITVDDETFNMAFDDLPPMPPLPAIPPIPGLAFSQDGNHFSMDFDSDEFDANSADMAEFEAAMEAWGAEMETWGEQVDARAEAWAAKFEPEFESAMEQRAEAWAAQVERAFETAERKAETFHVRGPRPGDVKTSETREFGAAAFDRIELGSGLSLVYSQGPTPAVTATLTRGNWDDVEISVKNGLLNVTKAKSADWNGYNQPQLTVYATSATLKDIQTASGSSFRGSVLAGDLAVDVSSGASMTLEGACAKLNLDASSGSSVRLSGLECKQAIVDASSGSSVSVFASDMVDIDASSGSSVSVSGAPMQVSKNTSSGASVSIK